MIIFVNVYKHCSENFIPDIDDYFLHIREKQNNNIY